MLVTAGFGSEERAGIISLAEDQPGVVNKVYVRIFSKEIAHLLIFLFWVVFCGRV